MCTFLLRHKSANGRPNLGVRVCIYKWIQIVSDFVTNVTWESKLSAHVRVCAGDRMVLLWGSMDGDPCQTRSGNRWFWTPLKGATAARVVFAEARRRNSFKLSSLIFIFGGLLVDLCSLLLHGCEATALSLLDVLLRVFPVYYDASGSFLKC